MAIGVQAYVLLFTTADEDGRTYLRYVVTSVEGKEQTRIEVLPLSEITSLTFQEILKFVFWRFALQWYFGGQIWLWIRCA